MTGWRAVALLIPLVLASLTPLVCGYTNEENLVFTLRITTTYINHGSSTWNLTKEDATVYLFPNNSWQRVTLEYTSHPIMEVGVDSDGNPISILDFGVWSLAPGENLTYTTVYRITSTPRALPQVSVEEAGTLRDIPEGLRLNYCEEEGCWMVNDEELRELAYNLSDGEENVLAILTRFALWISGNVAYKSFDVPLYPNETYNLRLGDCDDQANLLITLCRIVGIPAYLQIGCIYYPGFQRDLAWDGHLETVSWNVGWHGWAVVYVPPWGWLPVDLTYSTFKVSGDPLDAIRTSAIAGVQTILYVNITETDYSASTRALKEFLKAHNFTIRSEEEMRLEVPHQPPTAIVEPLEMAAVAVASCVIAVFVWRLYIRRGGVVVRPY